MSSESESIYQQCIKFHETKDEHEILDILDDADPETFDLDDIKILHMIHMYLGLKRAINEFNFLDLMKRLKSHSIKSRILHDIWIESITGTRIITGSFRCNEFENHQVNIGDEFFSRLIQSMRADVHKNPFSFEKYLADKVKVYESKIEEETDFCQNYRLKESIYQHAIQYTEFENVVSKKESNVHEHKSKIIEMIEEIQKLMNKNALGEAMNQMSQFKKMYGERSSQYFKSFLSKIQFLTKPSFQHAMVYYHEEDELSPLKSIPEISQFIEYKKIGNLMIFSNKLRMTNLLNDADLLNQWIEKYLLTTMPSFYQNVLEKRWKINQMTLEVQKTNNNAQYSDYLKILIDTSDHHVSSGTLGDQIIIMGKKDMGGNCHQIIDFYHLYKAYLDYAIRSQPNPSHIVIAREIIRAHYVAKHFNSMYCVNNMLSSFGLTVDYFRLAQDNPILTLIHKIFESIALSQTLLESQGYQFIENVKKNDGRELCNICTICKDHMDERILGYIQCTDCSQKVGHLLCFGIDKLAAQIKPCCGKIMQTISTKQQTYLAIKN